MSWEEAKAKMLQRRQEAIQSMTKEKMIETIMSEGLDEFIDFKFNEPYSTPGSVRLNRQPDGSFRLYSVGDRGIDFERTFTEENEAYYYTINLLREKLDALKQVGGPEFSRRRQKN